MKVFNLKDLTTKDTKSTKGLEYKTLDPGLELRDVAHRWIPATPDPARDEPRSHSQSPGSTVRQTPSFVSLRALRGEIGLPLLPFERKGQRRGPAADDGRFVSERIGWLPFAGPPGSLASRFVSRSIPMRNPNPKQAIPTIWTK